MSKKLTKEIVNSRIMDRGIELIGEYIDANTNTDFQCKCGNIWSTKPGNIMFGNGCPVCSYKRAGEDRKLGKETVNERLLGRNVRQIGPYFGHGDKTDFQCDNGHIWKTTPQSVLNGGGCSICSFKIMGDSRKISKEIVNQRLNDANRNIEMIGEYTNANTLSEFKCVCDYIWQSTPGNIMAGKGCPRCAKYGFQIDKPGWIYILIFETFIKYGITNDLDRRLFEHLNNGRYTVALTKLYEDGIIALNWERNIKIIFGGKHAAKEQCPDGWTETLSLDKLQLLKETVK